MAPTRNGQTSQGQGQGRGIAEDKAHPQAHADVSQRGVPLAASTSTSRQSEVDREEGPTERNGSRGGEREQAGTAAIQAVNTHQRPLSADCEDKQQQQQQQQQQQPLFMVLPPRVYGPAWLPPSVYQQSVPLVDDDKVRRSERMLAGCNAATSGNT